MVQEAGGGKGGRGREPGLHHLGPFSPTQAPATPQSLIQAAPASWALPCGQSPPRLVSGGTQGHNKWLILVPGASRFPNIFHLSAISWFPSYSAELRPRPG